MRGTGVDQPLQPGDYVGTYQLRELIGAGAISQVWRAHLPSDERRPVAIKILNERISVQDKAREHFRREAELMMRVRSPQILRVFNFEKTSSGRPYIVMEFLDGQDLKSYMSTRGPLSIEEALMVSIELLKALSELHRVGHIHSDLKPENVFLLRGRGPEQELRIKLIDFGSAVRLSTPNQARLTQGSYLYMAPEQLRRQTLSPATDLYGLGALMFTLISGKPPFLPTLADGIDAHLSQPIPKLKDRVPTVPGQLDRLLELCLNLKPEGRPASADALRRTLERLLSERRRRPPIKDSFLPADEVESLSQERPLPSSARPPYQRSVQPPQRSMPPATFSIGPAPSFEDDDEANPEELLRWLLKSYTGELAEDWARSISETPNFGRAQPHLIKVNATYYITLFSQISARRLSQGFLVLIDQLTPNLNPKSPEIAPLMCGPLLTPSLNRYMGDWSDQVQDAVRGELYDLFYLAHQAFIEAILVRYPNEYESQLKRTFSNSVELISLSSLSGQLRYTQPGLRSVFGASDESELQRRELFELLSGYQGLLSLKRDFREVGEGVRDQFSRYVVLHHPRAKGRALTLKVSPHVLRQGAMSSVMILFEMLEERQVLEPLSPSEVGDDFAPQAPLWVETMEVSALGHERFDDLYAQPLGEDEPTPVPGVVSPSRAPIEVDWGADLDISPPSSPYVPNPVRVEGLEAYDPTAPYDRVSTSDLPTDVRRDSEEAHEPELELELHEPELHEPELEYTHTQAELEDRASWSRELERPESLEVERLAEQYTRPEGYDQGFMYEERARYEEERPGRQERQEVAGSDDFTLERDRYEDEPSTDDYQSGHTELELVAGPQQLGSLFEVEVSAPPEDLGPERPSKLSSLAPDAVPRVHSAAPGAQDIVANTLQDTNVRQAQLKQAFQAVQSAQLNDERALYTHNLTRTVSDGEPGLKPRQSSLTPVPVTIDHEKPIYRPEGYEDLRRREEGPSSPRPRPNKINRAVISSQLPKEGAPERRSASGDEQERPALSTLDSALAGRAALTLDSSNRQQYVQQSATPSPIDTSQRPRRRLHSRSIAPGSLPTPRRSSPSPARLQSTNGLRLALHFAVFGLIATISWLYLPEIKGALSGYSLSPVTQVTPAGLPPLDSAQVPSLPQRPAAAEGPSEESPKPDTPASSERRALNPEGIRLIVTTKADVFVLDKLRNEKLLCEGSMVCDIPLNRDVIVRAKGFYERPLYQLELAEHRGSEWMLNLVKTNR